jgi:hypothetical protein
MDMEQFYVMAPEQQTRWLRREEWKVRLVHVAGWALIGFVGLVVFASVLKTLVLCGPLAAFFAFLLWSSAMLLHSFIRLIWRHFHTPEDGSSLGNIR